VKAARTAVSVAAAAIKPAGSPASWSMMLWGRPVARTEATLEKAGWSATDE